MNKLVRKTLVMSIILIMVMCLCACSGLGKTANCNIIPIESEIYTQEDYEEACQVVFDCFKGFTGCSMTEIRYTGDDKSEKERDVQEADAVIVLESTFDTDSKGGDGSLNPNDTYTGWQWILVRDKDGKWQHKDHGYG